MENFRDFHVADPFGSDWHVQFKYNQNGISIRHSDSVDVGYILSNGTQTMKRVVVLHHPMLLAYTQRTGRALTDTWCSRIAAIKLTRTIAEAGDLDREFLQVSPGELAECDAEFKAWEEKWLKEHAA